MRDDTNDTNDNDTPTVTVTITLPRQYADAEVASASMTLTHVDLARLCTATVRMKGTTAERLAHHLIYALNREL